MTEVTRVSIRRSTRQSLQAAALAATIAVGGLSTGVAQAAPFTWDPAMTPVAPSGGTGVWNISNVFWSDGANDFIWPNTNADTAIFGGTAGTVTIESPIQANGMTFNTAGYVINTGAGGSLLLAGTTPTINAAANATVNSAITGTAGLIKTGAGTLTLGGANAYAGATRVDAGTLALSTGASLASTSSIVMNGTGTLDLGGNTQAVANLGLGTTNGSYTSTITNGSLNVSNANGVSLTGLNSAASTVTRLDMSGLSNFSINLTAAGKTFLVNNSSPGGVTSAPLTQVLLGNANSITASTIQVSNGAGATGATPFHIAQLSLGQTNTINADTIGVGSYRGSGILDFRTGLTNPTASLRGYAGGTTPMNNLNVVVSNSGVTSFGTIDLSAGSVDGIVTLGTVAYTNTSGSPVGRLSIGGGTMTFGTLQMSQTQNATANAGNVNSGVNHNAGTVLVNNLTYTLRNPASGATVDTQTGTYNLGTVGETPTSGTLSAANIGFGAGAVSVTSRQVLNFNNGVITNYDPALGQAGAAAAVGAPTTVQNLAISGAAGGGAGNNNSTLTINLAAAGVHAFRATAGQSITVNSTALIAGPGSLTADGLGTVTLLGANTFAGGTGITAGTLVTGNNAALGIGAVSVDAAGTLVIGNGTNNTLGGIAGLTMADAATLRLADAASAITLAGGTFALGNTTLDLNNLFNAEGTFTLIDGVAGANAIGSTTFLNADTASYNYAFAVSGDDGVLSVTAVPEPAMLGLGLLAATGLIRRRRA